MGISNYSLILVMAACAFTNTAIAQSVLLSPSGSQTVTQPASGGARSTLGVNSLNNTYYVNQWCSTPGMLDDTCFSNAIHDVQTNALYDPVYGRRMQVLIVPPGVYTFNHTITVPLGINISIKGEYQSGIWGSVIKSGATPVDFFHVEADNVDIQHLSFFTYPSSTAVNAITLGTTTQPTFDTHINWCWFNGQQVGIHIVNGSGLDFSHNTFDSGTNYGIYSNASAGDIAAYDILATDIRGYMQISTVAILGPTTPSSNYQGYVFSGIFDHSVSSSAPISLNNVIGAKISGIFNDNNYLDINVRGSSGVVVSDFHIYNPGQTSIYVSGSNGVQISNGTIYNSSTLAPGAPTISVNSSTNTTVNSITSIAAGKAYANVGLYVDAASSGSTIYGNNLNAQSGSPYNVLDTTTGFNVPGQVNASSIVAANGFTGTKTAGACTFTIVSGIITNVGGC